MNAQLGRMAATMPTGPAHTVAPAARASRSDAPGAGSFASVLQGTLAAAPAEKPPVSVDPSSEPTADVGTDPGLVAVAGPGTPGPSTMPDAEPSLSTDMPSYAPGLP